VVPLTVVLSGPVLGVAAKFADPDGPQFTTPEPPSVQLQFAVTVWPNTGDAGEIVGAVMTGGFLSTSNGPNGPAGVDVFPQRP